MHAKRELETKVGGIIIVGERMANSLKCSDIKIGYELGESGIMLPKKLMSEGEARAGGQGGRHYYCESAVVNVIEMYRYQDIL